MFLGPIKDMGYIPSPPPPKRPSRQSTNSMVMSGVSVFEEYQNPKSDEYDPLKMVKLNFEARPDNPIFDIDRDVLGVSRHRVAIGTNHTGPR